MDKEAKQILSFLGIAAVIAGFIYGSYLPLMKSQALAAVLNEINGNLTVNQFEADFRGVLNYPSPVGQYEVLKQLNNEVVGFLQNSKSIPQPVADEVVKFTMSYNAPIIASGRGLNFAQFLVASGNMYQFMGQIYGNKADLDQAAAFYKEGLGFSPRRPQFLYGLFDVYLSEKDVPDALRVGEEIVAYWPTDSQAKADLEKLGKLKPK